MSRGTNSSQPQRTMTFASNNNSAMVLDRMAFLPYSAASAIATRQVKNRYAHFAADTETADLGGAFSTHLLPHEFCWSKTNRHSVKRSARSWKGPAIRYSLPKTERPASR